MGTVDILGAYALLRRSGRTTPISMPPPHGNPPRLPYLSVWGVLRNGFFCEERNLVDPAVLATLRASSFQDGLESLVQRTQDPEVACKPSRRCASCPIRDRRGGCTRFADYILGALIRNGCHQTVRYRRLLAADLLQNAVSPTGERGLRPQKPLRFRRVGSVRSSLRKSARSPLQDLSGERVADDHRQQNPCTAKGRSAPTHCRSVTATKALVSPDEIPGRGGEQRAGTRQPISSNCCGGDPRPTLPLVDLFYSILVRAKGLAFSAPALGMPKPTLGGRSSSLSSSNMPSKPRTGIS